MWLSISGAPKGTAAINGEKVWYKDYDKATIDLVIEKQKFLNSQGITNIPGIRHVDGNRIFFEYLPAMEIENFFATCSQSRFDNTISQIIKHIDILSASASNIPMVCIKNDFEFKLEKLRLVFEASNTNRRFLDHLSFTEKTLNTVCSSEGVFLSGIGHGDLNFSNIIFLPDGRYFYCDMSPTFVETPLWDLAKLHVDLKYGLSVSLADHYIKRRFASMSSLALKIVEQNSSIINQELMKLLKLLVVLRIVPYSTNAHLCDWCFNTLDSIKND